MILRDPYAGYRDYDNPNWDWHYAPNVDNSKWTAWDYTLASVSQLIDDYTNKNNGQLYWIDASDKVEWEVKSSFSGYDAALESERESHNGEPGESLYAVPLYDENDPPTFAEWIENINNDSVHPPGYRNFGHLENEILDARDDADRRRREIAERLKRGDKI